LAVFAIVKNQLVCQNSLWLCVKGHVDVTCMKIVSAHRPRIGGQKRLHILQDSDIAVKDINGK